MSMTIVSSGSTRVAASWAMASLLIACRVLRVAKSPSVDRTGSAPPYTRSSSPRSRSPRRSRRIVSSDTPNLRASSSAETAFAWRSSARMAWRR